MYAEGYGSHGCVNLPYDAAQELYGMCQIGDVVIVHW
jgi:lipoprotein-anchoring transpeptidase ErfK/SrfK